MRNDIRPFIPLAESRVPNSMISSGTGTCVQSNSGAPRWRLGSNHSPTQWQNRMARRGWTPDQITEAIQGGQQFPATNNIVPANGATRYVHPTTGRSVVVDNATAEVIHIGGDGYVY